MASTSETGHAKNVANFDKLIKLLSSVALYVPNEPVPYLSRHQI